MFFMETMERAGLTVCLFDQRWRVWEPAARAPVSRCLLTPFDEAMLAALASERVLAADAACARERRARAGCGRDVLASARWGRNRLSAVTNARIFDTTFSA
jgi:hypothetical protein